MGSKGDTCENSLLLLLFNNTGFANVGDATGLRGSTTPGSFGVSLHTASPGEAGSQTTSEMTTGAYAGYARVSVARSGAGWTVTANSVSPTAAITFPAGTGGTGATATDFGVGTDLTTGAGTLLYYGSISPSIVCGNGVTPQLSTATAITED